MLEDGFVRLPRKAEKLSVYSDSEKFSAYIKLLLCARFRETVISGITVRENQILCTKAQLAEMFNTSERKARTILDGFKRMGCIQTENIKNRYTLITFEEYSEFSALTDKFLSYINRFSAYLVNHPEKSYKSHYAQLCSHYYEFEMKNSDCRNLQAQYIPQKKEVAYDILRAEELARTRVPGVRKRENR